MNYAMCALIGIIIGVASTFYSPVVPPEPQKVEVPAPSDVKKIG
jgi:hypothetical protein